MRTWRYPRAHKFAEWWLFPDGNVCQNKNYIGLKRPVRKADLLKEWTMLAPATFGRLGWLKRADTGKYGAFVAYAADMAQVIRGCVHVLKQKGKVVFVLADNRTSGRVIPAVDLLVELLDLEGFTNVQTRRRRIKLGRRRYPFGFAGVMKTESVITAQKP